MRGSVQSFWALKSGQWGFPSGHVLIVSYLTWQAGNNLQAKLLMLHVLSYEEQKNKCIATLGFYRINKLLIEARDLFWTLGHISQLFANSQWFIVHICP